MNEQNISQSRHHDLLDTALGDQLIGYLKDPQVIELMLNPDGKLWVESLDQGKFFSGFFINEQHAANIIKLIASLHQKIVDEDNPELACELKKYAARLQAWLPPVTSAPSFTIRKLAQQIFTLDDYVHQGSIATKDAEALREAIIARKNILIAGGTGSGKTTFANALLHELRDVNQRVIILEDLPELQLAAPDHVHLKTSNTISMRDLVKGALRMRPDRIIIGEVREGGAALELLKAWNTGHPGGLCTLHANSAESTLNRLEDLLLEVVTSVPKRFLEEAIDCIVFMGRNHAGRHMVEKIVTVNDLR